MRLGGGNVLFPNHFREIPGVWRRALLAGLMSLAGFGAAAAGRNPVPPHRRPREATFSDLSGLTMAPDGSVFWVERDKGQMWRVAGDTATAVDLAGKELAFEAKKTGGIALLGPDRFAVVNTRTTCSASSTRKASPSACSRRAARATASSTIRRASLLAAAAHLRRRRGQQPRRRLPSTASSCSPSA